MNGEIRISGPARLNRVIRKGEGRALVKIDQGFIEVHEPANYDNIYSIPIRECSTRNEVLTWLRQLAEKNWVTKQVLEDFAHALIHHFDVRG
jgi:hypothetical protein